MRYAIFALAVLAGCQSSDVSRGVGARCDQSSECDERCLLPSADWPGGFCTISCDSDADCPGDAACVDEDGSAICAFTCVTDPGCTFLGQGYVCKERDAHGVAGKASVCRGG
ncbi:MAG TPA: hypothetical protein VMZ53_30845 [Kofleriaceae bacterium]|nr:hypothetical protein [Kofleriaceae bacterium]